MSNRTFIYFTSCITNGQVKRSNHELFPHHCQNESCEGCNNHVKLIADGMKEAVEEKNKYLNN